MEGDSGVSRSIIDDLHCSNIERDQLEGGSGVTQTFSDELHS